MHEYPKPVANPTVAPTRRALTGITRGRCQSAKVQSHLQPELDGGVEVEMAEKPPLQEDATIPFDVVSTAHLVDLQCMTTLMETSQIRPLYPPHTCMYILVTKPVPVSVQLQTQK